MLTAYDYPLAGIVDKAGVDIILVGDSLANVVLGLSSTKEVGMREMLYHTRAVTRAARRALVVGDMPYEAYQDKSAPEARENAQRFIREAKADAVKLEWCDRCLEITRAIAGAGIAVMGHIGLTPQTADKLGGFKVQGRDAEAARRLIKQAQDLEGRGCFSIVLECVPDKIAAMITQAVSIPTIGIGAGPGCDGQVLVTHDMLGLFDRFVPKFVKRYVDLSRSISEAVKLYKQEVEQGKFPGPEHAFGIKKEELDRVAG